MGVYFRREIANGLRAVASPSGEAKAAIQSGDEYSNGWLAGFNAALKAVGYGVGLSKMVPDESKNNPAWVEIAADRG